jgi:hypothetical protein
MSKVRVHVDRPGNTVSVWFAGPRNEAACEEVADDLVLVKDKRGHVIGIERLNCFARQKPGRRTRPSVEVRTI